MANVQNSANNDDDDNDDEGDDDDGHEIVFFLINCTGVDRSCLRNTETYVLVSNRHYINVSLMQNKSASECLHLSMTRANRTRYHCMTIESP